MWRYVEAQASADIVKAEASAAAAAAAATGFLAEAPAADDVEVEAVADGVWSRPPLLPPPTWRRRLPPTTWRPRSLPASLEAVAVNASMKPEAAAAAAGAELEAASAAVGLEAEAAAADEERRSLPLLPLTWRWRPLPLLLTSTLRKSLGGGHSCFHCGARGHRLRRFPLPPTKAATASADVDALAEAADVEAEAALSAAVVKVEATAASDGCHSLHGT